MWSRGHSEIAGARTAANQVRARVFGFGRDRGRIAKVTPGLGRDSPLPCTVPVSVLRQRQSTGRLGASWHAAPTMQEVQLSI